MTDAVPVPDPTPGQDAPTVGGLPEGYEWRVTRYADAILESAFPAHWHELLQVLAEFTIDLAELQAGGGNRTPFVGRFDGALEQRGWGKRNFDIKSMIDGQVVSEVRSHEIDMFKLGPDEDDPFPGVAVEMEWNNKDPFFDRDLTNYHALHRSGALAVGVVVTRGPRLQDLLKPTVLNPKGQVKYGESSTHWSKLMDRVDLGGGGECPLVLIGIEPERITNVGIAEKVAAELSAIDHRFANWRDHYESYAAARTSVSQEKKEVLAQMPEPTDTDDDED